MACDATWLADLWRTACYDPTWPCAAPGVADKMAQVSCLESGGCATCPDGINDNGTHDRGLWQINSSHWQPGVDYSNPQANAAAAVSIFNGQGHGCGDTGHPGFDEWCAVTKDVAAIFGDGTSTPSTGAGGIGTAVGTPMGWSLPVSNKDVTPFTIGILVVFVLVAVVLAVTGKVG